MKLRIVLILLFTFLCFGVVNAAPYVNLELEYDGAMHKYSAEKVYIYVNGEELTDLPMEPVILSDYTLVPVREIFEKLGATVLWDKETYTVTVSYGSREVQLAINSLYAYVDGSQYTMDIPAKIINDKTMVPVRFISQSVGLEIGWDPVARIITVDEVVQEPVVEITSEITTVALQYPGTQIEPVIDAVPENLVHISGIERQGLSYVVKSNTDIGNYDSFTLEDGRLVIDINNAYLETTKQSFDVSDHPYITGVRLAQFSTSPSYVTRAVFDIPQNTNYEIKKQNNSVIVSFEENRVTSVYLSSDNLSDNIYIEGENAPNVEIELNGKTMYIDTPVFSENIDFNFSKGGNFVKDMGYKSLDLNKYRITLELEEEVSFKLSTIDNVTQVKIAEPTYKNFSYNTTSKTISLNLEGVDTNRFVHEDDYNNRVYKIKLDGDYSSVLGYGKIEIDDDYIEYVEIDTVSNKSVITIKEKKILVFNVSQDGKKINIKGISPKEKYNKILVLDAGHGGKDPGASGNGLIEKDLTLDILLKTKNLIESTTDIKVYATRTTDVYPSFDDRTDLGNEVGDMFISVHINNAAASRASGTETYHYRDNTSRTGLTSTILAEEVQKNLLEYLGSFDRKTKVENFIVLRQSENPAVLIEVGFLSNKEEADKMGTDEYRQKVAQAICDSVINIFDEYKCR